MVKEYRKPSYGKTLQASVWLILLVPLAMMAISRGIDGWLVALVGGAAGFFIGNMILRVFALDRKIIFYYEESYDQYGQSLSDDELMAAINDPATSRRTRARLRLEKEWRDDI